jgi:hypothetical protein
MTTPTHEIPRSLAEGWARFDRQFPADVPDVLRRNMRRAFYAGAATTYDMVVRSPEMGDPVGEGARGIALLERLQAELERFASNLLAEIRTGGRH